MNDAEKRANEAAFILESGVFRGALVGLDERIVRQWRTTPEPRERQRLWLKQQCLNEIRGELLGEIEKMARTEQSIDGFWIRILKRIKGMY